MQATEPNVHETRAKNRGIGLTTAILAAATLGGEFMGRGVYTSNVKTLDEEFRNDDQRKADAAAKRARKEAKRLEDARKAKEGQERARARLG